MASEEAWEVSPAEKLKIDAAVRKWKVKPKELDAEELRAMKWLFESLYWEVKKCSVRLFMQDLYGHIAALELKLSNVKPAKKGTPKNAK